MSFHEKASGEHLAFPAFHSGPQPLQICLAYWSNSPSQVRLRTALGSANPNLMNHTPMRISLEMYSVRAICSDDGDDSDLNSVSESEATPSFCKLTPDPPFYHLLTLLRLGNTNLGKAPERSVARKAT